MDTQAGPLRSQPRNGGDNPRLIRTAFVLSAAAVTLMVVAAAAGLAVDGFYTDIPWAAQALRGGDLVTLVLVAPLLSAALGLSMRGSERARLIWAGALGYAVYTYAYMVFGAEFNDLFLVHVAILSLVIWALILLLAGFDAAAVAARFTDRTPARAVAVLFGVVTLVLAGLWISASLRQAITGELPAGAAPPAALHMVYATDLTFFVVPLGVTTVLLWRRTRWGYLLGVIMAVTGGTYLVNLMAAAAFQARAHVDGVAAFSPVSLALDVAFIAAALAMLITMSRSAAAQITIGHESREPG
jgi:hypothetical protein